MKCLSEHDVVILAGGLGTRLRDLFPDRPKVMVPVDGQPILAYLIEQVRRAGARRIILALGHLSQMVQEYVKHKEDGDLTIVTHVEENLLGTGGALRAVLPLIESETVLVMNGDSLTKVDLRELLKFHRGRSALLSVVVTFMPDVGRYGVVETDNDGLVLSFTEKPEQGQAGGYINAGLYLVQRTVICQIPPKQKVSLERDVFPLLCGGGFYALKGQYPFIDIGTPESYRLANDFFTERHYDY